MTDASARYKTMLASERAVSTAGEGGTCVERLLRWRRFAGQGLSWRADASARFQMPMPTSERAISTAGEGGTCVESCLGRLPWPPTAFLGIGISLGSDQQGTVDKEDDRKLRDG